MVQSSRTKHKGCDVVWLGTHERHKVGLMPCEQAKEGHSPPNHRATQTTTSQAFAFARASTIV